MNKQTSSEVRVHSGQVQAVAQNSDARYGVKIDGAWYEGFGRAPVKKGAQVEITYETRGDFRNIKAIRDIGLGMSATVPDGFRPSERHRLFVVYCVALKAAASCWPSQHGLSAEGVKKLAESFAEWLLDKSAPDRADTPKGVSA